MPFGYDLALCTTASSEYLDVVLPLCGIDRKIFRDVIHRDKLKFNPKHRCKDLGQFSHLGYSQARMVTIDDRVDLHWQCDNLLQVEPFEVNPNMGDYHEDTELLLMIEKLKFLGRDSLAQLRKEANAIFQRETALGNLVQQAFDSSKYRELPFQPKTLTKRRPAIDRHPNTALTALDVETFLIYKNYGLVGAIKKEEGEYLINNLCPTQWTDVPSGLNRYNPSDPRVERMFWFRRSNHLMVNDSESLGYIVSKENSLALGALTLTQTHDYLHFLAYQRWFEDEDPMLFK